MSKLIGLNPDSVQAAQRAKRLEIIQTKQQPVAGSTTTTGIHSFLKGEVHPSLEKFLLFWALMDTIRVHGYSRAAMSTIGRAAVGAWWKISEHDLYRDDGAPESGRRELLDFYAYTNREWDNIKDFQTPAHKFMLALMYLKYFGQGAFYIHRNNAGQPLGLDFLPGLIVPNVDDEGYFKSNGPAFVQYPTRNPRIKVDFDDPFDIVYLTNPDWEGSPVGGSDIEALSEFALPLDIYLQTTAREYMKNRNKPELIYMLPTDISDDAFDTFVEQITNKYSGPKNVGRNPIAVQGELGVKELDSMPSDLPYAEGRNATREEAMAVAGTHSALLGLGDKVASAALKEIRRHFHETTMEPLFAFAEQGLYEQVHIREFGLPEWKLKFNSPDFLNAVERATVHRRYFEIGVYNPNEIRQDLSELPREGGDEYYEPNRRAGGIPNNPGSPPEGREDEPDADEPTDNDDPARGDQHDEETEHSLILSELYAEEAEPISVGLQIAFDNNEDISIEGLKEEVSTWRRFVTGRMKKDIDLREFETKVIPENVNSIIHKIIEQAKDAEEAGRIFEDVINILEAVYEQRQQQLGLH